MSAWLLFAAAAGVGVWLFVRSERARARLVLTSAAYFESVGEYEAACFHYAVASRARAARSECEANVRRLWLERGPFTFEALEEGLRSGYCAYEGCGEGHHSVTVADIRRIIEMSSAGTAATHQ